MNIHLHPDQRSKIPAYQSSLTCVKFGCLVNSVFVAVVGYYMLYMCAQHTYLHQWCCLLAACRLCWSRRWNCRGSAASTTTPSWTVDWTLCPFCWTTPAAGKNPHILYHTGLHQVDWALKIKSSFDVCHLLHWDTSTICSVALRIVFLSWWKPVFLVESIHWKLSRIISMMMFTYVTLESVQIRVSPLPISEVLSTVSL